MSSRRRGCILIFRLGSIGDTLVALPCFHAIAREFADYRRVLLTNVMTSARASSAETILDGTGLVDEVIYYPAEDFGLKSGFALMRRIRRLRPAALIYLQERKSALPVYRDLLFFKAAGVPAIMGSPLRRRLRECALDADTGELEYEPQRLARTLRKVASVSLSPANFDLRISASEVSKADAALEELKGSRVLVAMAPGAKVAAKAWGADNWRALSRLLAECFADIGLVVVGAADERALGEEVAAYWTGRMKNLCGSLTPRETAAALRRCRLLVCHDSGPMHLAASQQTPCVALFGNANLPRQWYPFGNRHRIVYEPRGIGEIGVARVADEIRAALDAATNRQRSLQPEYGEPLMLAGSSPIGRHS